MDRKEFLSASAIFGTATLVSGSTPIHKSRVNEPILDEINDIPNFCSHEHWGSISNIGSRSDGFVADLKPGALPLKKTTLIDLLVDPYLSGSLRGNGVDPQDYKGGGNKVELFHKLKDFRLKGTYQSLRIGINFAHGYDIHNFDPEQYRIANNKIGERYQNIFSWYKELMAKANLSDLVRPVQPEFYFADFTTRQAQEEMSFTSTVLRIDPFLEFWKETNTRRDYLVEKMGIDPLDAKSWKAFLEKIFSIASKNSCVGIKQMQAYSRSLDFSPVSDSDVKFRGELSTEEKKKFQDWIVHACCELVNQRKWPHQIHVGTNNHPESNPLPLKALASMYPDQKIVMIHCWPYIEEAGYLAQAYSNIYIDTCWQPVLNPHFLKQSLDSWLGYIPLSKITMSNDCTSVEMATGASMITRRILSSTLEGQKESAGLFQGEVREIAAQLLHNNAVEIYGLGQYFQ